ncbi:lipoprotein BA_5634 family protein [Bacillus massiliigorillae]|uniref:lipoprotein BA_5634 family protein n=1 Tax=Bacillus massiliigorillae TaxID=1243664 RepID=UPI00039ED1AF|nr:lipoprotein BA_5634 family protein [Bacillus massiliigorillae]
MKKWIILLVGLCSFTALAGCSLIDKIIGERANGIIVYGNEEAIKAEVSPVKNDLKSFHLYETKITESNAEKIMIMDKTTADALFAKGLFREIKDEKSTPIHSLPTVTKEQSVLFAKDEISNPEIEGKSYATKYEGNIVIGSSRHHVDSFMIMDHEVYQSIKGENTTLGVLLFKKASKPETSMTSFKELSPQLITIIENKE